MKVYSLNTLEAEDDAFAAEIKRFERVTKYICA